MILRDASSQSELANLLVNARKARGLTQTAAAKALMVHRSYLSNAENGRSFGPGVIRNVPDVYPDHADEILRAWNALQSKRVGDDDPSAIQDDQMLKRRSRPSLEGDWVAIWQTTVETVENLNSEVLHISASRREHLTIENEGPSPENLKGGFKWTAEAEFLDGRYLAGVYAADDPNTMSKGTLFGVLHRSGRFFTGVWAGCNYDADLASGGFVFARSIDIAKEQIASQLGRDLSDVTFYLEQVATK